MLYIIFTYGGDWDVVVKDMFYCHFTDAGRYKVLSSRTVTPGRRDHQNQVGILNPLNDVGPVTFM